MFLRRAKPPLLVRLTALTSSALVLLLAILAASPALHEAFHHAADPAGFPHQCRHHSGPDQAPPPQPPDDGDELCIISQFAGGHAEIGASPGLLAWHRAIVAGDSVPAFDFCAPSAPAHILPPGCGPPLT